MADIYIGVEIGGTKLQAALGSPEGRLSGLERAQVDRSKGAAGILAWVKLQVGRLVRQAANDGNTLRAVGIGFGGPVDARTGKVLVSHQIEGWQNVELTQWTEGLFHLPAVVANDANAAGWAEFRLGAGRGTRNFCYMNIGSGIGGALILDGVLYNGQGAGAGEIGHLYVPDWTAAVPGATDKLEHLCSGWAIERRINENPRFLKWAKNGGKVTCAMLAEAARSGDAVALSELDDIARTVGIALANVITLFHPEKIALGGGVSLMGNVLLDRVRHETQQYVFGPFANTYVLEECELAENVVLAGAVLLASAQVTG